jgi:hypothetical protein
VAALDPPARRVLEGRRGPPAEAASDSRFLRELRHPKRDRGRRRCSREDLDLRRDRPAFRSPARVPMVGLSYWRTCCRVLGKVLGELTRRVGSR